MVFSSTNKVDNMLGSKANLNKFNKIKIIKIIFSDHNRIKWKIDKKRNLENTQIFRN